jgi:hypothetical protein
MGISGISLWGWSQLSNMYKKPQAGEATSPVSVLDIAQKRELPCVPRYAEIWLNRDLFMVTSRYSRLSSSKIHFLSRISQPIYVRELCGSQCIYLRSMSKPGTVVEFVHLENEEARYFLSTKNFTTTSLPMVSIFLDSMFRTCQNKYTLCFSLFPFTFLIRVKGGYRLVSDNQIMKILVIL